MTKAQIMKRAWEIKREDSENIFGLCLRMAWAEAKAENSVKTIEELEELGFSRWTKGNFDRLYINADKLGLECGYYNTGNVRWASFNGEKISNSQARRLLSCKIYIDLAGDGKVHGTNDELVEAACRLSGREVA